MKLEIEVGWLEDDRQFDEALFNAVAREVERKVIDEEMMTVLRRRVREMVEARIAAIADEQIGRIVEEMLAVGWTTTDEWGTKKSQATVSSLVRERLTKARTSEYGRESVTVVDHLVAKQVEETLRGEFKDVVTEIRTKFESQVDAVVQAKLVETLRKALGV